MGTVPISGLRREEGLQAHLDDIGTEMGTVPILDFVRNRGWGWNIRGANEVEGAAP